MLDDISSVKVSRPIKLAVEVRDLVKSYVTSMQGSLPWQWEPVRSRGIIFE